MKPIKEILDNYNEYETPLEDRFGYRLSDFLTVEEMESIGIELKDEYKKTWEPQKWTKENIIEQLKDDIEFGIEKAENQRGISANLMFCVVKSWLKVLEDDEMLKEFENYDNYGLESFYKAKEKYMKKEE